MERKILYIAALFPLIACTILANHQEAVIILLIVLIMISASIMTRVRDELKEEDERKISILTIPSCFVTLAYLFDTVITKFKNLDSAITAYALILFFIDYISLYSRYNKLRDKKNK